MKAAVTAAENHRRHHSLTGLTLLHLRRDSLSTQTSPAFSSPIRGGATDADLESFQRQVSDEFHDLHAASDDLLSIAWIQKLLESFLRCHQSFQTIILKNRGHHPPKPPAEKILSDLNDRMIKALDVLNGVRDGTDQVRDSVKLVEIVLCALEGKKTLCEGHLRRAKKAISELAGSKQRPFGQTNGGNSMTSSRHVRSLSWSNMSRGWSVGKQIHAIGSNLNHPKGSEMAASNGLAMAVYTMGFVVLFVMWALAVAIPCQDGGAHGVHFAAPRQLGWGGPMALLYGRVMEEAKKRKGVFLLREVNLMEELAREVGESIESEGTCPKQGQEVAELGLKVEELRKVFEAVKEGLVPLERKVRQVFHQIVKSRNEEHEIWSS